MPIRIQRKRKKGWRLPPNAKCVTRGTSWGNMFPVEEVERSLRLSFQWPSCLIGGCFWKAFFREDPRLVDAADLARSAAVEMFRRAALKFRDVDPIGFEGWIAPLRGRDLACYCGLYEPCHADVLLVLANGDVEIVPKERRFCLSCGLNYAEFLACEDGGCRLESEPDALRRLYGRADLAATRKGGRS